ncbi:MAG: TIGR03087 family PEP-CTERM/XrtA system glycosyltransferase [Gemmataceae bacterium]|nr:TIGR03087 family PEP-CTERM/XrtA system glycosyltransferase [Gemmata sp.]MDW8199429.1 TIGR03087 family PEP-CTERM/XrtA system glycosyltransferase [Gemmataceae bacterium]
MTQPAPDRPRVLLLTHRVPFPPDKGDRIRTFHLLRELTEHVRVWLACPADEPVTAETRNTLHQLCERVAVVPVGRSRRWLRAAWGFAQGRSLSEGVFASRPLARVLRQWADEVTFHAVVASASSVVPYFRDPVFARVPKIVDLIDVDSQKWLDYAAASRFPKSWLYRLEAVRVRRLEQSLVGWAKTISVVSLVEAKIYEALTYPGAATVATNGVDTEFFAPAAREEPQTVAFVGALDYRPNVDGVRWFVQQVWPEVRSRFPTAEFRIIGRHPVAAVRALASVPGVRLVGQVPDIRPFAASVAVVVVPLRLARGVQNKLLEAMAMGRAVVASPASAAPLPVKAGEHLLIASTPAEWVESITALLANADRRHSFGRAARNYVQEYHNWERCLRPLIAAIVTAEDHAQTPLSATPRPE